MSKWISPKRLKAAAARAAEVGSIRTEQETGVPAEKFMRFVPSGIKRWKVRAHDLEGTLDQLHEELDALSPDGKSGTKYWCIVLGHEGYRLNDRRDLPDHIDLRYTWYTGDQIAEALEITRQKDTNSASKKTGIPVGTIYSWQELGWWKCKVRTLEEVIRKAKSERAKITRQKDGYCR